MSRPFLCDNPECQDEIVTNSELENGHEGHVVNQTVTSDDGKQCWTERFDFCNLKCLVTVMKNTLLKEKSVDKQPAGRL